MKYTSLEQAMNAIQSSLENFINKPMPKPNLNGMLLQIEEGISRNLRMIEERGEVLILADGMRAVVPRVVSTTPESALIQWRTDFFPCARFRVQEGACMPLGFFEGYDLYIDFQWPLPPTFIARYGNLPQQYETLPIHLVDPPRYLVPEHFIAALDRAVQVGIPLNDCNERDTSFFVRKTAY